MNKLPYKPGTSLQQIIADGWSRGFSYDQTLYEAQVMGFDISKHELQLAWAKMEREMEEWFYGNDDIQI